MDGDLIREERVCFDLAAVAGRRQEAAGHLGIALERFLAAGQEFSADPVRALLREVGPARLKLNPDPGMPDPGRSGTVEGWRGE